MVGLNDVVVDGVPGVICVLIVDLVDVEFEGVFSGGGVVVFVPGCISFDQGVLREKRVVFVRYDALNDKVIRYVL